MPIDAARGTFVVLIGPSLLCDRRRRPPPLPGDELLPETGSGAEDQLRAADIRKSVVYPRPGSTCEMVRAA